jgi:hypothetical protein
MRSRAARCRNRSVVIAGRNCLRDTTWAVEERKRQPDPWCFVCFVDFLQPSLGSCGKIIEMVSSAVFEPASSPWTGQRSELLLRAEYRHTLSTVLSRKRILLAFLLLLLNFLHRNENCFPNPVGFNLNGTHSRRTKLHVTHSKDDTKWQAGLINFKNNTNLFICNSLAERVGFYYSRYLQVPMNATLPA